jgi:hypothetical protein
MFDSKSAGAPLAVMYAKIFNRVCHLFSFGFPFFPVQQRNYEWRDRGIAMIINPIDHAPVVCSLLP